MAEVIDGGQLNDHSSPHFNPHPTPYNHPGLRQEEAMVASENGNGNGSVETIEQRQQSIGTPKRKPRASENDAEANASPSRQLKSPRCEAFVMTGEKMLNLNPKISPHYARVLPCLGETSVKDKKCLLRCARTSSHPLWKQLQVSRTGL